MFLLSFIALIVIAGMTLLSSQTSVTYLIDLPSLLILLFITVPVLIQTELLKDFNNSFRLTVGKKTEASFKEIKRAIAALELVRKTAFYTAVFSACVSVIIIMRNLTTPEKLGPTLAVAILTIVYAAFLNIIFLPMEKQLEVRLIEFDREEYTEEED